MLFHGINMNTSTCFIITKSIISILNLLVIFEIKIYQNLPKFLTIQKSIIADKLSVTNFATTIKLNAFDGSNYKRWRERLILWLTTMNLMHVKKGKPEQFAPEEGSAFDAFDNLFPRLDHKCSC
jgi:hypothetical protein